MDPNLNLIDSIELSVYDSSTPDWKKEGQANGRPMDTGGMVTNLDAFIQETEEILELTETESDEDDSKEKPVS